MSIKKQYESVKRRISQSVMKAESAGTVDLLAVSKKQPIEKINSLYQQGHRMFGESYVQEAIAKIEQLAELDIQWHFIGPIQSNKTRYLARYFDWVQSVDSLKIITRLNHQRTGQQPKLNVLLQLKVGGEQSKKGMNSQELLAICARYGDFANITIRGLMSIPAPSQDYQVQKSQFQQCQEVFQQMSEIIPVDTLSMGMSADLEAAIESGSTMVRIGTDIFGQRQ
ncbi:MAG TPA: YggS family pyridoxal phosphate-dependent enzyme [Oceanospirillales bacterium]|nr:YggS family pyridoxal phosphate-dependent enzyme [Oceanospirillales bacterium]